MSEEKKVSMTKEEMIRLGELTLKFWKVEEKFAENNVDTLIDVAAELWDAGNGSPEHLAAAKKFLEVVEAYKDPFASDMLTSLQENPIVSFVMAIRTADRGASGYMCNFAEDYEYEAQWWRKKIAEAEGKNFEGEVFDDEMIFNTNSMKAFNIYKKALEGDIEAMKTCLEFCEKESAYWNKRFSGN